MDIFQKFSKGEEISHSITHGLGIGLSITALILLIITGVKKGDPWYLSSVIVYGISLIILYSSSTIYHGLRKGKAKNVFEIFDHASIFILIAGCYTPFALTILRDSLGWYIFGMVWIMAVGGVVFKALFIKKYQFIATLVYLLMGWVIVIDIKTIIEKMSFLGLVYLVVGGLMYSIGAVFFVWRFFKYNHMVWHFFVLAGSIFHFFVILFYI